MGTPELTEAQAEIVGQFNDPSFEHTKLKFTQVPRKTLGSNPFPRTPNGAKIKQEWPNESVVFFSKPEWARHNGETTDRG